MEARIYLPTGAEPDIHCLSLAIQEMTGTYPNHYRDEAASEVVFSDVDQADADAALVSDSYADMVSDKEYLTKKGKARKKAPDPYYSAKATQAAFGILLFGTETEKQALLDLFANSQSTLVGQEALDYIGAQLAKADQADSEMGK